MSGIEYATIPRFFVYLLVDPRDGAVRYVGCTIDPKARMAGEASRARKDPRTPKLAWIRELLDAGLTPTVRVVDEAPTVREAAQLEQDWIAHFVNDEADLLNVGGQLTTYQGPSLVARRSRSAVVAADGSGGAQLRAWMAERHMSQARLVALLQDEGLSITQTAVSRWLTDATPKAEALVAVRRITGIPVESWFMAESDAVAS